ncbi:hypothetical protein JUJ52_10965 [Virgibacillus sp. AGTR]|uniref:hypothetical protein n=1 Tax=Virgibacillus TaxID=84406 RepID=UPI001D1673D5|nr:hypothetical protein [Virgibacillus sp. AGTR]MCC2250482.1 hypothetical protein [Virgibacillus sp. AGTR]
MKLILTKEIKNKLRKKEARFKSVANRILCKLNFKYLISMTIITTVPASILLTLFESYITKITEPLATFISFFLTVAYFLFWGVIYKKKYRLYQNPPASLTVIISSYHLIIITSVLVIIAIVPYTNLPIETIIGIWLSFYGILYSNHQNNKKRLDEYHEKNIICKKMQQEVIEYFYDKINTKL